MGDVVDMKAPERVHKCETAPKWAPIKHEEGKWSLLVPTCPPTAGKPLDYMRGWVLIPLTYCPWCGDGLDGDSGEHRQAWKRLTTYARHEVLSWLGNPGRGANLNAAADVLIDLCDEQERLEFRQWQMREAAKP